MGQYQQPGNPQPAPNPYTQPSAIPQQPLTETQQAAVARDTDNDFLRKEEKKKQLRDTKTAAQELEAEEEAHRTIHEVIGDSIVSRRQKWLWRDRVPLNGLSLLVGKGDVSKSTLFCQMAAWLTIGDMKGEFHGTPMRVGYIVHEDALEETVVPRMRAHGANMSLVSFLTVDSPHGEDALRFPHDAERLKEFVLSRNLACVFIDPLSASITGKPNDQREMRNAYQTVNTIGIDTNRTLFGLAHMRKGGADTPTESTLGSSEQTNVARSVQVLVMDPDEDGARILSVDKGNLAEKRNQNSLRFKVNSFTMPATDGTIDLISAPKIEWLEEIADSAADVLRSAANGDDQVDAAVLWLDKWMSTQGYEAYSTDIKAACKFSMSTLHSARKRLGIVSTREKKLHGRSIWIYTAGRPTATADSGPEAGS